MEKTILKFLNREIIKSAKKDEICYYWDVTELNKTQVKIITEMLEADGKTVKSKGENFKIIHW
jgi:hypothetical protein